MLSWEIISKQKAKSQSAYRILVSDNLTDLLNGKGIIWDSGKILSEQSINVPFGGKPLKSGKRYFWKVKIWDEKGQESSWSQPSTWQMGLLTPSDWDNAKWIAFEQFDPTMRVVPGVHGKGNNLGVKAMKRPVIPMFRKSFFIEKQLVSATLSISGMGSYQVFLNGEKVGNSFLMPGWTDYDKTVFYNTYDVTSMLQNGKNVVGAIVGNGFYNINRERYRKLVVAFGMPEMIAHLHLIFADGSSENIVTNESWKTAPSPITFTSIYGGEDYDASQEQPDWSKAGFDSSGWQPVLVSKGPAGKLTTEKDYPLKEMETLQATRIIPLKDGSYLYDFGQNASGIIELTVQGNRGQQIKLWPSELINPDSTFNQKATGTPYYFTYTLKGNGIEIWKPKFTYYGFRYVQVFGAVPAGKTTPHGLPVIQKLNFLHTRNSAPENGTFLCSNELLNKIHTLIDWAIKSNLQSVLTDCPHREKLGWLEQTYLMGNGVHFRYDNYHLYKKLVFDMMDAQTSDGLIPDIAPEYVEFSGGFRDSPEWGSASVILPYLLYKWYGDVQIIDKAWPMMVRYINYLKNKSDNHFLNYGLGDWFDLGTKQPGVAQLTPTSLTATAIYFYDVKIMAEMASITNKPEKRRLQKWAGDIRKTFNSEFFNPELKVYSTGSQTAMSMPYCFGIVNEKDKKEVLANLIDSIVAKNKALTAGDVGFHYLIEALTKGGASQLIFEMINRDDVPGYGFQLKKGATALTESWEALENVSNNHLMLGHVMEWFYAGLAGIQQSENSVAYKEIVIKPEVVGDLSFVKAGFKSPYGLIRSEWKRTDKNFEIEVEIPFNTTAKIILPTNDLYSVKVNGKVPAKETFSIITKNGKVQIQLGSGIYYINSGVSTFF
ncbi:MAG: family 78 glycoside hydrolase catalytic domain [Prolixibacteraceae bacterium]|nr:family 78 glycoside hydrolase catalytic domain [Prolixibacteraceae bacterium]